AQVSLLVQGWYEPPASATLQLSTLIQQILSLVAQYGGVTAAQAWTVLCDSGLFVGLSKRDFALLLHELGSREVLMQAAGGVLLLGTQGEEIVNRYDFLAAFTTVEEFQVVAEGRPLGALPVDRPLVAGSYIILAGRRWQVVDCLMRERIIQVIPAAAGRAPMFSGLGGRIHGRVREEMRNILASTDPLPFLDSNALEAMSSARQAYRSLKLHSQYILGWGETTLLLPWASDAAHDTIAAWLRQCGLDTSSEGIILQ